MSRTLRRRVELRLSRNHTDDPAARLRDDVERLISVNELQFSLDIPDAAAPLLVTANVKARNVIVSMSLDAPKDRQRAASRVNWLLRQLAKTDPQGVFIKAGWPGRAADTQASLAELRTDPNALDHPHGGMTPSSFEVLLVRDLAGRFSGTSNFLDEIETVIPEFYERVGQYLRAYVASPPRIQREIPSSEIEVQGGITTGSTSPNVSSAPAHPQNQGPIATTDLSKIGSIDTSRPNESQSVSDQEPSENLSAEALSLKSTEPSA
jgi:hypothetical protein